MTDKEQLPERVKELRLNPDAIEEVRVHVPGKEKPFIIPNADGKRNSLQIWASAADREGYVSPSNAKSAVKVYGHDYRLDAASHLGNHPAIDYLEQLAESDHKWRVDVVRRNQFKRVPEHVKQAIREIKNEHESFYVYDGPGIEGSMREFNQSFGNWTNFTNFFAVKALPYLEILKLLNPLGSGLDCSSAGELKLGESTGYSGERKIFTSNNTHPCDFKLARDLGAIINLDDITFIEKLERAVGRDRFPETLCFRWNPGPLREGNDIIGDPEETKYGLTNEQLPESYKMAKAMGVKKFGLHTMIVSNMLREEYLIKTGQMLFEQVAKISKDLGITFDFIDVGGGVGIPYRPEQKKVDLARVSEGMRQAYSEAGLGKNGNCPRVVMECGRAITGPHGYLGSRVINMMKKYRNFIGLDTSINNLLRAGIYSGSYHHATVFDREDEPQTHTYDLVGRLCEGNDKTGINRTLPEVHEGDTMMLHDAGAHGAAMRNNYNFQLGCPAFLVNADGSYRMIEDAQTEEQILATQMFEGSGLSRAGKE